MEEAPPCRAASKAQVECPLCARPMSAKWLRYAHQCGRSWRAEDRVAEEVAGAKAAFSARAKPAKQDFCALFGLSCKHPNKPPNTPSLLGV